MTSFEYVEPPVRAGAKSPLSPGQELILEALRDLPDGKAVAIEPTALSRCSTPRNLLNSVGRTVRKVRERHFPEQFHRQYWHGGKIYIERTV